MTRSYRIALGAVLVWTSVTAAAAFVWTWRGNMDTAYHILRMGKLSFTPPAAVDGAILAAVAAILALRNERARIRAYAWLVFMAFTAVSIGGNLAHASYRGLPWTGWVGSAAAPALMGFSSHLVVIVWRSYDRHRQTISPVSDSAEQILREAAAARARRQRQPEQAPAGQDPPADSKPPRPDRPPRKPGRGPARGRPPSIDLEQVRAAFAAQTPAELAGRELGVSKRTVERAYAQLRREQQNSDPGQPDAAPGDHRAKEDQR